MLYRSDIGDSSIWLKRGERMPRKKKNGGEPMAEQPRGRGRPPKEVEKIPAEFDEILEAVLKPERRKEEAKD